MGIKFKSFSSGSSGNCYWLGIVDEASSKVECSVLIDAGVSLRRVRREMQADSLQPDCVSAMLMTHDHFDHIRSLGSYCKYLSLPVWSTDVIHGALSRHVLTHEWMAGCKRVLKADCFNEIVPGRIFVRYFIVPHDATQTVGFAIRLDSHEYVHITDCGRMTPEALEFCSRANTIVLESNYDPQMLRCGKYPVELQERIRGGRGHLSNDECARALESVMHEGLKNVFLCHLSENNNTPQKAYEASRPVVPQGVRLQALPRCSPTGLIGLACDL